MNKATKIAIIGLTVIVGYCAYQAHHSTPSGEIANFGPWGMRYQVPPTIAVTQMEAEANYLAQVAAKEDKKLDEAMVRQGRLATGRLDSDSERFRDAMMRAY